MSKKSPKNAPETGNSALAEMILATLSDGVIMTDKSGVVKFINPAALTLLNFSSDKEVLGLDYGLVLKIETKEGRELSEAENPLIQAVKTGQKLEPYECCLIANKTDKRVPVAVSLLIANNSFVITLRDITKDLEAEGELTEFISTASHEMRTPVATIDGYLTLALNPQTATIDERARGYLASAEAASKHLGKLFQDLLDVTKLDDGRIRPKFVPAEMVSLVEKIANGHLERAKEGKINFTFGSADPKSFGDNRRIEQVVYGYIDEDFLREILDNLIDNALKYTPEGGSIYVNVRGDGDRVLINVTDSGIGISADDLGHIFQKFYRADNSDTRTVGGTGLGLYLVKQRTEAMGGRVWAESAFGEGSTFYVSLPRLTADEYEKRMIPIRNQMMQTQIIAQQAPVAPAQAPVASVQTPVASVQAPAATTPAQVQSPLIQAPDQQVPASAPTVPTETLQPVASVPTVPAETLQPVASAPVSAAPVASIVANPAPTVPTTTTMSSAPATPSTSTIPASPSPPPLVETPPAPPTPEPPKPIPEVANTETVNLNNNNLNGELK